MSMKLSPKSIFAWILTIGFPLGIFMIPTSELFTDTMRTFLMITVAAIIMIAFENVPTPAVTFLLPVAYVVLNITTPDIAWSSWAKPVFWMVVGALLFVNVLETSGLLQRISFNILRMMGGSYVKLLLGLALIGTFLNIILFGNAYVLLAGIAYDLCKALDLKPLSVQGTAIFLIAAISGIIPTCCFYGANLFMIEAYWSSVIETHTGILDFTFFNIPFILYFFLAIVLVIIMYPSKEKVDARGYATEELKKLGAMTLIEKKAVVWIVILFAYVMYCGFTGGDSTMAFIIIPGCMLLPAIGCGDGNNVKNLDLTFILFVSACMSIGFVAASLNFGALISALSMPLIASSTPTVITIVIYWINVILNFLLTPMAVMAGFTSSYAQIAVDAGMNPLVIYSVMTLGLDQIVFPYEYALYLMYFSFGYISMKEFIKYFSVKLVLGFVCLCLLMIPFWKLTGLFMM